MSSREQEVAVHQAGQVCRIIAGAMIFGLVSFSAVALVLGRGAAQPYGGGLEGVPPMIFWVLALVPMAVSYFFQPGPVVAATAPGAAPGSAPSGGGLEDSLKAFQSRFLAATALREGGGLLGAIAVLLTKEPTFLVLPALGAALIAIHFPTRERVLAAVGAA